MMMCHRTRLRWPAACWLLVNQEHAPPHACLRWGGVFVWSIGQRIEQAAAALGDRDRTRH
jgi:hypothetical protein